MANPIDILLTLLIPALVLLHLFAAPYTKVEESFNIQAIHDILVYGYPDPFSPDASDYVRTYFDHATFSGSVPRTFVGAAVLSGLSRPWIGFLSSPAQAQLLVRGLLGLLNALVLVRFRPAVDVAFGTTAGRFYLLFIASQFHLLFYASRTLPNMLAFPLTTEALRAFLLSLSTSPKLRPSSRRRRLTLYLLSAAAMLFRAEIALLLFTVAATSMLYSRLSIRSEVLPAMIAASIIALPLTFGLDTLLWRPRLSSDFTLPWKTTFSYPIWPELQGFLFNAIDGKSSDWGTSPWHWYFSSALPKLLLNPLTYALCVPISIAVPALRRTALANLIPTLSFVAAYSLLPHKEWRFVVYTVPSLTAVAAAGASYIFTRRAKSAFYNFLSLLILASIPISILVSTSLLSLSAQNYPGGHALASLHNLAPYTAPGLNLTTSSQDRNQTRKAVHMTNLALQTGVTRFQEIHRERSTPDVLDFASWVYDKSDDAAQLHDPMFWESFDYAIVENPMSAIGPWDVLSEIKGYAGVGVRLSSSEVKGDEEQVLFPLFVLPTERRFSAAEELLRGLAERFTRGYWPYMRLRTRLYVLQKGEMPV
ncbi:hypothetical protein ANO11243_001190 [Dothideomycetidae sp. 11243]|nr:hypothetical protein ANO11243_001190 [fungal sp. No.11243]